MIMVDIISVKPRAPEAPDKGSKKPSTQSRRRPSAGKKAVRDPVGTKERILQIAAEEFANRGYDGARVDEIVRRSKVSKNLVYHYFGSKDALFVSVLEDAYTDLRKRQEEIDLVHSEPLEGVRRLVVDSF